GRWNFGTGEGQRYIVESQWQRRVVEAIAIERIEVATDQQCYRVVDHIRAGQRNGYRRIEIGRKGHTRQRSIVLRYGDGSRADTDRQSDEGVQCRRNEPRRYGDG